MRKNSLGDRMKEYERTSDTKLVRRLPMIVRLDGKAFHSWTKKSGCVRPFDHTFIDMMAGLAQYLCENIGGAELAYGQSDEISILVRDDQNIDTDAWFDKRLQKVVSIVASMATYWFNANNAFEKKLPAFFDARAFILPEHEVKNYFIWRQEDATTNSLSMLAQSLYRHGELQHRKWWPRACTGTASCSTGSGRSCRICAGRKATTGTTSKRSRSAASASIAARWS